MGRTIFHVLADSTRSNKDAFLREKGERKKERDLEERAPRAHKQVKMMPRHFSNFASERGNSEFLYCSVHRADMNVKRFARCNDVISECEPGIFSIKAYFPFSESHNTFFS